MRLKKSTHRVKHGYDHVGSVVKAFVLFAVATVLFLIGSNMAFEDCLMGVAC